MACNLIFYFLFLIDFINDDASGINLNNKQLEDLELMAMNFK